MIPKSTIPFAGLLCLSLGACTDEPSEANMRLAASDLVKRISSAQVITTFRKIGCEPAAPSVGGHVCGFETAFNGGPVVPGKGRFFNAADGTLAMVQ